jgi:hypothetical protein
MHLQYLSDDSGKQMAVVIPIDKWKALTTKYTDLESDIQNEEPTTKKYTMADFVGTISPETANALLAHTEQSRDEWERNS